jgi:multiple sugar transport system permease protein
MTTRSSSIKPASFFFGAVLLVLLAAAALLPLGYMAALSAKGGLGPQGTGPDVWAGPWRRLFETAPLFGRWFLNSTAVAFFTVAFHLTADAMAGYVLAKRPFRGRASVFTAIILAMTIPRQVTLIPLFLGMSRAGLADTFFGLVLPGLGDVVGVFLMRQFIISLPDSLLEAARMDGASSWGVFRHVVVPLSIPALSVLAVLSFQHYWSDFFWPVVILHDQANFTVQVGLAYLVQSEFGPDYALLAAGACAAAIPPLAIFFLFRRAFFEGMRVGALK